MDAIHHHVVAVLYATKLSVGEVMSFQTDLNSCGGGVGDSALIFLCFLSARRPEFPRFWFWISYLRIRGVPVK